MTQQPTNLDNKAVFEQLWEITKELRQKLEARFELNPDPSVEDLQQYSSLDGNINGSLSAFSGTEIDWLVHSWLGNPEKSKFSTMRLTTWLASHIQVPHLAFEFGTLPNADILFYIDYIPRTELLTDLAYLDRYYEPVNQAFLQLQEDARLKAFTSKSVYVRLFQSPVNFCYTGAPTSDTLEITRAVAHQTLERWLTWINTAEPVSEDSRTTLANRDLLLRRTAAERDPGNKFAAQLFGTPLTDKLIRSLWGGDRIIRNA
ncbi:red chlorophyll catabolite reductase [Nostoc sp. FACHB-973]|nr:red chlorophyll catabolite reductase [Nostoc sp. FACHB-973]